MSGVDLMAPETDAALATADSYHPTALILPDGLSFERWGQIMATVFTMERGVNWWVGDGLNYGEHAYGEKYTQAIEATGRRLQSLMNMASVAGRIDPARRRAALSWSCHRAVAYLEPADQDRILGDAERQGWGSREVEDAVAALKKSIPAPPAEAEQSTRAGRLSGAEESTRSGEILPEEAPAEEAAAVEASVVPDEGGFDLTTELEHLQAQVRTLETEVDALSASDLGAEVRKWTEKYARLEGRLQQELATSREAQKQAKYYGDLLKKIRTTLGVPQTQQILPRLLELLQEVGS